MPKNTESLNRSLFDLLHSKGFDPTMLDTSGKEIPTPEEADVFQFNFVKDGEDYGKVTISVDGLHKLVIYFSDDIASSEKEEGHGGDESWYKVLNQLKRFSQKYQLSFELRNVDHLKHDMAKREYMKKQERISEGYYPMGKKASYSDAVPSVKIILQHTRQIEEGEQRYRNIAKIFLENQEGERFLAPTVKPGVARVYGRLIAEGDKPHGERWNHVTSLVEEYQKMGAFVRATRNGQFNESAQRLVNEGINHYQGLRETLGRMTGHRGYNSYFESWTPSLMEDETEETNLNELFVQETLDPRIESVMPILNKLQKKVAEMKEVNELSEWADSLSEAPDLAEGLDIEKRARLDDLIGMYRDSTDPEDYYDSEYEDPEEVLDMIKAEFGDKVASQVSAGEDKMHYPRKDHARGYDSMEFKKPVDRITKAGKMYKQDSDSRKNSIKSRLAVDETDTQSSNAGGIPEGMFDKVKDAVKSASGKVLDKLGHGSDEELLKKLQKSAGIPARHGKPNMGHPKDEEQLEAFDPLKHIDKDNQTPDIKKAAKDVDREDYAARAALMKAGKVKDDRGPQGVTMAEGEGNLALALDSLKGGWSGWHKEEDMSTPEVDHYEYDDGEGNYYGSGTIEHNLKTGEIKVEFHDSESDVDVDDTFNSVGDAMKAIRGPLGQNHGGKAPNFDKLGQRKQHGPDDLRKTDRTGRKGTLAGAPTNSLKQNIQWSKGKHGPKGVLPEGQEDLDIIKRLLGK